MTRRIGDVLDICYMFTDSPNFALSQFGRQLDVF